jgi:predicted NBD/HSP70 family sugar kinase
VISLNIARGFMVLCPIVRPDVIVIGGGVGTHFNKFSDRLMATLRENMMDFYVPLVVEAVHPEKAVVYGCYYHALDVA